MTGLALVHTLTLLFAGSLAASLLAALRHVWGSPAKRPTKILATLHLAWFFALLSAVSLVVFAYALASTNVLDLLSPPSLSKVIFSRPFILFTLGSLYLLPALTLVLEDAGASRGQHSSEEVHLNGRHYGTF